LSFEQFVLRTMCKIFIIKTYENNIYFKIENFSIYLIYFIQIIYIIFNIKFT
jgi:hypothetical protein